MYVAWRHSPMPAPLNLGLCDLYMPNVAKALRDVSCIVAYIVLKQTEYFMHG